MKLLTILFCIVAAGSVDAQQPSLYTSVHKGLEVETSGMDADSKQEVFDRLNGMISTITSDPEYSASVAKYASLDLQGKKSAARDILNELNSAFTYTEESTEKIYNYGGTAISCKVTYVEEKVSYSSTTLLSEALMATKNGKLQFDCDTSSFIYIAALEASLKSSTLPVVLLLCAEHALIRWKFSDGSYIDWETTGGHVAEKEKSDYYRENCREVVPGTDEFYSIFYNNMGISKVRSQDYEGALSCYNSAVELSPGNPFLYFNRAYIRGYQEDFKGAVADYDRAIELRPRDGYIYLMRGVAKFQLSDYSGVVSDFDKALELSPNDKRVVEAHDALELLIRNKIFPSLYKRAKELIKEGDYEPAIAMYDEMLKLLPGDKQTYTDRAFLKYATADYLGALYDYNKVIELDPKNAKAYKGRGLAKFKLEKYESAIKDYEMAAKLDPENSDTYRKYKEAAEARLDVARN